MTNTASSSSSTVTSPPAEGRVTPKAAEKIKLLEGQVWMLANELEVSALTLTGRNIGASCPICQGGVPISRCPRCSRIKSILDALKAVGR